MNIGNQPWEFTIMISIAYFNVSRNEYIVVDIHSELFAYFF